MSYVVPALENWNWNVKPTEHRHIRAPQTSTIHGFTLLEVMVALAILAIALTALMKSASENAVNTAYLRDKTFASIVAANKASEMFLAKVWPSTGNSNGIVEMANDKWQWNMTIENTEDTLVRRMIISVNRVQDPKQTLYTLTSFIGQP